MVVFGYISPSFEVIVALFNACINIYTKLYYIKSNYYFCCIDYFYVKHFYVLYKEEHIYCNFLCNVLVTTVFLLLMGRLQNKMIVTMLFLYIL